MRLSAIGFGKVRAVKCYVYLLVWLIFVSVGLYWFLNRTGKGQSSWNYNEEWVYNDGSITGKGWTAVGNSKAEAGVRDESGEGIGLGHATSISMSSKTYAKIFPEKSSESTNEMDKPMETDSEEAFYDSAGLKAITRLCNPVEFIKADDENVQVSDYKLEAVAILFRHGDRGPLTHIGHRNISHINCSAESNTELDHMIKFASDNLIKLPGYSQFVGPFHSFPRVSKDQQCALGQLSQLGSAQLLALGKMIRSTYKSTLINNTSFHGSGVGASGTSSGNQFSLKVLAYSTRYRRTFQSLFAFLFGLLGPKNLISSTTIRESQSINFCFNDCSCRGADRLKRAGAKKYKPDINNKIAMSKLVNQLNGVLGMEKSKKTGNSLLDSLLVYPCHKLELPCHADERMDKGMKKLIIRAMQKLSFAGSTSDLRCISLAHLSELVKFIQKENIGLKKIAQNQQYHLLSSYGLMKEIANVGLKMTSAPSSLSSSGKRKANNNNGASSLFSSSMSSNGNYLGKGIDSKTKLVIFSGHDTTLQSLTAALGILSGHPDVQLPPYSSRLIFEFYRRTNVPPNSPRKHYFRVIYNGISVTHLVRFCRESSSSSSSSVTNTNYFTSNNNTAKVNYSKKSRYYYKTLFCPMEKLVRFIHDRYFDSFGNVTNYKDACQL